MMSIVTRILFFCLIPAGIFLLIQGIKWIRKTVGGAVLLNIPLMQTEARFTVEKEGSYAIWQKGKTLRRMAINMPVPIIYNEANGQKLRLVFPVAIVTSNDGSNGRIRLLTFDAPAGQYCYKLSAYLAEQNTWFEKMRANKKWNATNFFLEIKENRSAIWLMLGILVLILSAFCIIFGLVFTINSNSFLSQ